MNKLNLYRGQNRTLTRPAVALFGYREPMMSSVSPEERHDDQLSLANGRAVTFEAGYRSV